MENNKKDETSLEVVKGKIKDTLVGFSRSYLDPLTNGEIYIHENVNRNADDFNDIYEISIDKAKDGSAVYILPVFHVEDPLWITVFEGAKERKCPDIKVDGIFTEIKCPTSNLTENKISNCIRNCHQQANHIVIILRSDFNFYSLNKIIKGRFKVHEELQIVDVKMNGNYMRFKRSDYL